MQFRDLSIATVTLARDAQEEALLRAALGTLSQHEMPIAVADGGSPAGFREFLGSLRRVHVVKPRAQGLVGQVAASLHAAAEFDTPFVLYTEPDKHVFFGDHLLDFLARIRPSGNLGVVIAGRSSASFGTFPVVQQNTEAAINQFTGEIVGPVADYSYGPFVLNRSLVPYLDRVPADIGWGWRHFIFVLAHRLGMSVETVEGHYPCPPEQRMEPAAERVHRLKQLAQNLDGLLLGLTTAAGD